MHEVKATSSLRNAIRAAHQKNKEETGPLLGSELGSKDFDGGFFVIKSPNKVSTPHTRSKSLLKNVLTAQLEESEASNPKKTIKSSPGLVILRASQLAKSVEKVINRLI